MEEQIGRRRLATIYMWLAGIATAEVVLQGFLFSGFYGRGEQTFIDIHGYAGELTGYVLLVVLIPLGFLARFPRGMRMGWWAVGLAILWNLQTHVFGYGIEDFRWFEMLHIPAAFGALFLALYLTYRARNALAARAQAARMGP